jgi:hypothetical protein
MTRRAVRLMLMFVCIGALGAASYVAWSGERDVRSTRDAARAFDDASVSALSGIADLRAAQQAYVAAGQGEDFWIKRTAALLNDLRSRLASLRSGVSSQTAIALDEASGTLQDFEQMDVRVREFLRAGRVSAASDLIFSDGLELTRKAVEAIAQARAAERLAADASLASTDRRELVAASGAAGVALVTVLLLVPGAETGSRDETAPIVAMPTVAQDARALDIPIEDGWSPAKRAPKPPPAPPPAIDLAAMASLCGDLARVTDTRALPTLLERAAGLLDASGIILWIADPDGRELNPIVAHGYPAQLVTRLGTIRRDAENVTAAAFRTSVLQTVKADAVSNGAIAAPLLAASGCAGVMAAEVRNSGEQCDATLAAAAIVAAQLATLVGPPTARPHTRTEAAGA